MITHDTIHGKQFTQTLTEAQEATIQSWHLEKEISFHVDGSVRAILFEDNVVQTFTFYRDGSLLVEERDLANGGWSQLQYNSAGTLKTYSDFDKHDVEHDTYGNKWYGRAE